MKRFVLILAAALFLATDGIGAAVGEEEIRQMIIRNSLAGFGSNDCPCPYSYAWNGQQ